MAHQAAIFLACWRANVGWQYGRMDSSGGAAEVTVREVAEDLRPVVERLAQLERHDLSEFRGSTPRANGLFAFDKLPLFFSEPDRHAYLIYYGSALAGFTLTRGLPDGATSISAFFIVRALRRQAVGHQAALALLRMQPGPWAIAFQEENAGAARFWRRIATAAVGSAWREERRSVPGKPAVPPDTWLLLDTDGAHQAPVVTDRCRTPDAGRPRCRH
ncbi:GNAT family N-acetyltransferase [Streptomyces sp. KR80]|uniref:GNAT family N-acetyltransferase n=1 Tax=Streptomyces sp. KR80 TaxID=3457426 RepID=UPI003FD4F1C5